MDRTAVATVTIGAAIILVAGLAGVQIVWRALRRRGRWDDGAGLATLGVLFLATLILVLALLQSDLGARLPAPPTPPPPVQAAPDQPAPSGPGLPAR